VLSGVGAGFRNLDPIALARLVRSWTGAQSTTLGLCDLNPYDPINMQCHEPGMSFKIGKSCLYVNEGESVIKACSIKEYPTKWHPIAMGDMIGDPFKSALRLGFPFAMSCTIYIPKQEVLVAKYTTKRTNTQNNAKSIGRFSRKTMETAKDLDFMMKLSEEGQKLVKVSFDYLVFGNSANIDANYTALTTFLDAKKWRYSDSKYTQLHAFIRALPMGINHHSAKAMGRFSTFKTLPAQTVINLLPMQGEAIGSESPAMIFGGRRGQIFFWDPFLNQQGNYNVIVAASSGA
jgi:conjugal transfer ATP-binding protein TraC